MGSSLSSPVEIIRVQRTGSPGFRVAVAETQGWRPNHEDAHAMFCKGTRGSFWVLDGHGGDGAANYSAPVLAEVMTDLASDGEELPPDERIADSVARVDDKLRSHVAAMERSLTEDPTKASDFLRLLSNSGSTVIGAIATQAENGSYALKLVNCGDSRGIVVRGPEETMFGPSPCSLSIPPYLEGKLAEWRHRFPIVMETVDHKPKDPAETARIQAAGGLVERGRVDGVLAVSRSLGDFEFKTDPSLDSFAQKVSCQPDVYQVTGLKAGSFCVLACDGVWDKFAGFQVADFVHKRLKEGAADLGDIAAELVRESLGKGSRDNITAMIIHCTDGEDWASTSETFNSSDELQDFGQLQKLEDLDEAVQLQYKSFLERCRFPPEPETCRISGRWFLEMVRCPDTNDFYSIKEYQKDPAKYLLKETGDASLESLLDPVLARIKSTFTEHWGQDGERTMTQKEMWSLLQELDSSFTQQQSDSLFHVLDKNSNGVIEYIEFIEWVYGSTAQAAPNDASVQAAPNDASALQEDSGREADMIDPSSTSAEVAPEGTTPKSPKATVTSRSPAKAAARSKAATRSTSPKPRGRHSSPSRARSGSRTR